MAANSTVHSPKIRTDSTVNLPQATISDHDATSAYREGAVAARQGAHSFSCPYIDSLEHAVKYTAWMDGFNSIDPVRCEFPRKHFPPHPPT